MGHASLWLGRRIIVVLAISLAIGPIVIGSIYAGYRDIYPCH